MDDELRRMVEAGELFAAMRNRPSKLTPRHTYMSTNERLMKFLQATPEQQSAIDRILDGLVDAQRRDGPLLLGMGAGAKKLGVSRATLWRMIQAHRISKVEVLPGSFRVRAADIEAVADGKAVTR